MRKNVRKPEGGDFFDSHCRLYGRVYKSKDPTNHGNQQYQSTEGRHIHTHTKKNNKHTRWKKTAAQKKRNAGDSLVKSTRIITVSYALNITQSCKAHHVLVGGTSYEALQGMDQNIETSGIRKIWCKGCPATLYRWGQPVEYIARQFSVVID